MNSPTVDPGYRETRMRGTTVLLVTRIIAALWAIAATISAVITAVVQLTQRTVGVTIPVGRFWPTLPDGTTLDGNGARVVGGGFSSATVDVDGLDGAARAWLAAGTLVQAATSVTIAIVILLLCTKILRRDPFAPALIKAITTAAGTVIAGGILWQVFDAISGRLASQQVLNISGAEWRKTVYWDDIHTVIGLPESGNLTFSIDLWPIGIGLALLCIAAAFRYGGKLQRDTEGLV